MKFLFIHQNFPAQFKHSARALAIDTNHQVVGMAISQHSQSVPGVQLVRHSMEFTPTQPHPYLIQYEKQIQNGLSVVAAALELQKSGFVPDVICAHPGWGEALFIKDVFPKARLVCYQEFYYRFEGSDVNFDPEFPRMGMENAHHLRVRNSSTLQSLACADANYSPTEWQRSQYPKLFREKIDCIHDGIDTDVFSPDPRAWVKIGVNARHFTKQDEVITFVNRNLEPYRGFHSFMKALPEILRRRPKAHVVIIGGDDVSYGSPRDDRVSYRQHYFNEIASNVDLNRIIFCGRIPYMHYLSLLQISSCHVYLTYPFVLSWSMLEAMSTCAPIVGSKTGPVLEVIENEFSGLLTDFLSPLQIADSVCELLNNKELAKFIGTNARNVIQSKYDLKQICLPKQIKLLTQL